MKTLKTLSIALMAVALTACGGGEEPAETVETTPETTTTAEAPETSAPAVELPGEESSDIMDLGLDNALKELDLVE